MRARVVILLGVWAATLALVACGGSDGGDEVADSPQATVTVTVPETETTPEPAEKATGKGEGSKRSSKKETRIADVPSGTGAKEEPTSGSGGRSKGSPGGPGPGQVQATNGSPPEVTLAVIDAKSAYVKKSVVARYAALLDDLEPPCREARAQLAEAALTASHATTGTDAPLSILDVLKEVVAAGPSGVCGPAFTGVSE